jgi:two-component system nitrogen regulation sensor histidine kinase NtrY
MLGKFKNKFLNLTLKKKFIYLIAGIITTTPTILIGLLASVYYYLGIESLFNEQISNSVSDAVNIAQLYLKENKENVKFDLLQIEKVIDKQIKVIDESKELNYILNEQVISRGIAEAMIFTSSVVLAKSSFSFSFIFQKIPPEVYKEVDQEKVVLLDDNDEGKVRAITKLDSFYYDDVYLIIGKYIDKDILNYLNKTKGSAKKYYYLLSGMKVTKHNLQIAFVLLSTLMCFFSFVISVKLSRIITMPLNRLLDATSKLKDGDYSARVPERELMDEISLLGKAFNKMAKTIEKQHNELNIAYKELDERMQFIEVVLREISSGVIALDEKCQITLYNNSAKKFLSIDCIKGSSKIFCIIPEIEPLINKVLSEPKNLFQDNIIIKRKGRTIHLFIKIGAIIIDTKISNIVISFEDITQLVSVQREAAWSDVARRIAHEIKNPLTPIQLSAEMLHKKYSKHINKKDVENYQKYVSAIIRNVNDIHSIVSEFIQFARIPKPKLAKHELVKIIKDVIFNQRSIYKNIQYSFESELKNCYVICDKTQITQVMSNIVKNSAESICLKYNGQKDMGRINLNLRKIDNRQIEISIKDNGSGIDDDLLSEIADPYVTTKKTGMGLGLSIVKKILEDHESTLHLRNTKTGVESKFNLKIDSK